MSTMRITELARFSIKSRLGGVSEWPMVPLLKFVWQIPLRHFTYGLEQVCWWGICHFVRNIPVNTKTFGLIG